MRLILRFRDLVRCHLLGNVVSLFAKQLLVIAGRAFGGETQPLVRFHEISSHAPIPNTMQRSERELSIRIAMVRSLSEPVSSLREFVSTQARYAQVLLSEDITLVSGLVTPLDPLCFVLRHTLASEVRQA